MSNTNVNTAEEQEISRKGGRMAKLKPSPPPEVNEYNIPTDGSKGKASKTKKYRGMNPRNKPSLESKSGADFQGRCTDSEGYTFDLGPRAFNKFPENEGTVAIPRINIQLHLPPRHHY